MCGDTFSHFIATESKEIAEVVFYRPSLPDAQSLTYTHTHTHTHLPSRWCACVVTLCHSASLLLLHFVGSANFRLAETRKWSSRSDVLWQSVTHRVLHTRTPATGKVCVSEEIGLLHSTFHHICRTHTVTLIIWTLAIHFHLLTYILTHTLAIYSRNTGIARWPWTFLLHLFINRASWDRPKLLSLTQVLFGWCLCLVPSAFIVIQHLTQSASSWHLTCPNHLNLPFLITTHSGFSFNNQR